MELFIGLVVLVIVVLIVRLFGAWMLRINDVIDRQDKIIGLLKSIANKK